MGSRDSRIALPAHSCVHVLPGAGASFPRFRSRSLVRSTRSGVWLRSRAEQTRDRSARLYAMSVNVLESMRLFAAADSGVLRGESFGGAAVTTRGVTDGPRTQKILDADVLRDDRVESGLHENGNGTIRVRAGQAGRLDSGRP